MNTCSSGLIPEMIPLGTSGSSWSVDSISSLSATSVVETDIYETDKEVQNLIDWVCIQNR